MSLFWTPRSFRSLTPWTSPSPSPSTSSGFSSLFRMLDDFEKYAQQQVGSFGGFPTDTSSLGAFAPKFDVTEHENEYNLQGELPGVPTENVEIEFTDPQTMVVRGHAERQHTEGDPSIARLTAGEEQKKIEGGEQGKKAKEGTEPSTGGAKYWLSERSYGEFSRVFSFPTAVDQDKVSAKFNNGILDIKVPKAETQGRKKITVN